MKTKMILALILGSVVLLMFTGVAWGFSSVAVSGPAEVTSGETVTFTWSLVVDENPYAIAENYLGIARGTDAAALHAPEWVTLPNVAFIPITADNTLWLYSRTYQTTVQIPDGRGKYVWFVKLIHADGSRGGAESLPLYINPAL